MYALIANETHYDTYGGCPPDCDNCGGWCHQGDSAVSVSPVTLHRERRPSRPGGYEQIEPGDYNDLYGVADVPVGQTAYLLVVTYTDGGTFGSSGFWCVPGVFATAEEAEAARKRATGENDTDRAYRPWDGYFASLTDAEVYSMTVLL